MDAGNLESPALQRPADLFGVLVVRVGLGRGVWNEQNLLDVVPKTISVKNSTSTQSKLLLFQKIHNPMFGELQILVAVVVRRAQQQQLALRHDSRLGFVLSELANQKSKLNFTLLALFVINKWDASGRCVTSKVTESLSSSWELFLFLRINLRIQRTFLEFSFTFLEF